MRSLLTIKSLGIPVLVILWACIAPPANAQSIGPVTINGFPVVESNLDEFTLFDTPHTNPANSGTEFWVAFPKNFRNLTLNDRTQQQEPAAELVLELAISSESDGEGTVDIPGINWRKPFLMKAGEVTRIRVPATAQVIEAGAVTKQGVHVTASVPVTVVGLDHRYQTTDSYMAIPVGSLGTSYRAMGYRPLQNDLLSQLTIVASEDNTTVTITPTMGLSPIAVPVETPIATPPANPDPPKIAVPDYFSDPTIKLNGREMPTGAAISQLEKERLHPKSGYSPALMKMPEYFDLYSIARQRRAQSGYWFVSTIIVDPTGKPVRMIMDSTSDHTLDDAIMSVAAQAHYTPAMEGGVPVMGTVYFGQGIMAEGAKRPARDLTPPGTRAMPMPLQRERITKPQSLPADTARPQLNDNEHVLPSPTLSVARPASYAIGRGGLMEREMTLSDAAGTRTVSRDHDSLVLIRSYTDEQGHEIRRYNSGPEPPTPAIPAKYPAGVPYTVTLNRGDTYAIMSTYDRATGGGDLTGTVVSADKRFALFSGHNCAYVPTSSVKACNILVEQIPSVNTWGKQFVFAPLQTRSTCVYRVLASEDNTEVTINGSKVATLKAGEYYEEVSQNKVSEIGTSAPVLVMQFSKGFDNGDNVGDPMMITIAPVEQYSTHYLFATASKGPWHSFVNLALSGSSPILLDGKSIVGDTLTLHKGLNSTTFTIPVSAGTHTLQSESPFGAYSYGFGYDENSYDAYGNTCGQEYKNIGTK